MKIKWTQFMKTTFEDIILIDRGFWDVIKFLIDDKNIYCSTLAQLDTLETNRFVIKIRWVTEQVFDQLKNKFKIFSISIHNATLAHNFESLLIAFAFLNLFHKCILSNRMYDIANVMKSRINIPNRLKVIVEE